MDAKRKLEIECLADSMAYKSAILHLVHVVKDEIYEKTCLGIIGKNDDMLWDDWNGRDREELFALLRLDVNETFNPTPESLRDEEFDFLVKRIIHSLQNVSKLAKP